MITLVESENFYSLKSLIEKYIKDKDERTLKILDPYLEQIKALINEIKKKDNLILYSNLKINKIRDEYNELQKELIDEENNLIDSYLSAVEKEIFYISPMNLELKELAERARSKKSDFSKIKNNYELGKLYMDKNEQELKDKVDALPENEQKLYQILKEYALNDKDVNKIKSDLELLSGENSINSLNNNNKNNYREIIKDNKDFLRETKEKMKPEKDEINALKEELKNDYERKARKSMNHLNYNNNISLVKNNTNDDNYYSITDVVSENASIFNNSDLNKTNSYYPNNKNTNFNKTYYLRTNNNSYSNKRNNKKGENATYYSSMNNNRPKNYSQFLNTESTEKGSIYNKRGKKNSCICKRLLKNYCNKSVEKNQNFLLDLKMKETKENQSVPKSLYLQRRMNREDVDDYIYINGNRYKQSLIGKATNTINGVY